MEIIAIDFESYYDKDYSLTKLTTEQYIRDPRFEVIMVGIRMPDGNKFILTGTHAEIKWQLDRIDWSQYAVVAHNAMFDGAILSWVFGIVPKIWLDTLSMSRAMFGGKGNSLAALAKRYNMEEKGTEVHNMMGRSRGSLTPYEFQQYAKYCEHDVDLCYDLFHLMANGWYDVENIDKRDNFPMQELQLIDVILRMYIEPVLRLNKDKLVSHLADVQKRKEDLLAASNASKDDLMSNIKFAGILESFGVNLPMKISPVTGKAAFAFAKTDPGMKGLLEHSDERVQAVVSARMGVRSTLEETRTLRFIDIAGRGALPVPLKYGATKTHRLSGHDKINLQNLPARGVAGNKLKSCIEAPAGYTLVDCDSSNIEARVLAWLAGQTDLVSDFANNVDVYCKMASRIYGMDITKENKQERFVGKTVILGCGYQTAKHKLQATLKAATPPMELELDRCDDIIKAYRQTYNMIPSLWRQGDVAIEAIYHNRGMWLGKEGVLRIEGNKGVRLPNGLYINYPMLHRVKDDSGRDRWQYKDINGFVDLYGGKLIENCLSGDSEVLTDNGWKRILKVSLDDRVWDGTGWVRHTGVVCNGVQQTVNFGGVWMTPDHKVLVDDNWVESQHASYEKATSSFSRSYRIPTRGINNPKLCGEQWKEIVVERAMQLWERVYTKLQVCRGMPILWVQEKRTDSQSKYKSWHVSAPNICSLAVYVRPMHFAFAQSMGELRWQGYNSVSGMEGVIPDVLGRYGAYVSKWFRNRSQRQQPWVLCRELSVGDAERKYPQYPKERDRRLTNRQDDSSGVFRKIWDWGNDYSVPYSSGVEKRTSTNPPRRNESVYDITNAGPNHRFTVRGRDGRPFLVHNCVQALARIVVTQQLLKIARRYKVVLTVHDAVMCIARKEEGSEARVFVEECMRWVPKWAAGCPINCESGIGEDYGAC